MNEKKSKTNTILSEHKTNTSPTCTTTADIQTTVFHHLSHQPTGKRLTPFPVTSRNPFLHHQNDKYPV